MRQLSEELAPGLETPLFRITQCQKELVDVLSGHRWSIPCSLPRNIASQHESWPNPPRPSLAGSVNGAGEVAIMMLSDFSSY